MGKGCWVGIHCPALDGDGKRGISLQHPFHMCATETRMVMKDAMGCSAASASPKAICRGQRKRTSWYFFCSAYIFSLKRSLHCAALNNHVLEAQ